MTESRIEDLTTHYARTSPGAVFEGGVRIEVPSEWRRGGPAPSRLFLDFSLQIRLMARPDFGPLPTSAGTQPIRGSGHSFNTMGFGLGVGQAF